MNSSFEKFKELLTQIFQFDASDLDFGIYRILNFKRQQTENFINEKLANKVNDAFAKHKDERLININQKFDDLKRKILENFGEKAFSVTDELKEEFRETPLCREYLQIKAQRQEAEKIDEIKAQVFNDLYNFFSRYYEDGDFVPKYRYSIKGYKYAIPYNGEEIKLYWANCEQYYTKTGLLFRDYTFKLNEYKVIFRIVEAEEELGSNKATKQRFFILDNKPIEFDEKAKTLLIRFQYRELFEDELRKTKTFREEEQEENSDEDKKIKVKQEEINLMIEKDIFSEKFFKKKNQDIMVLKAKLSERKDEEKSILLYHLNRFTGKNTRDYFIHKNLKKFLSEQLDYFIKSEILSIETLEEEKFLDKHITRAKVVREIGQAIIDFLAQIEDFQKRLWEKKKFVLKTEYVITLDRIKEYAGEAFLKEILPEILNNEKQSKEWKDLSLPFPSHRGEEGVFPSHRGEEGVLKWYNLPYNPALKEKAKELRKAGNLSEVLLWKEVNNKKLLNLDFDRQKIIGNYIVDFYCKDLGVVIEIDGISHEGKIDYDEQRDNYLKSLGLKVIHILDDEVKRNLQGVINFLETELKRIIEVNTPSASADTPLIEGNRLRELSYDSNFFMIGEGVKLPIDTRYFSEDFKERLLEKLTENADLDDLLDGVLIKSENFQALNLLLGKYREKVQTIYIDPPFNKEQDADYLYNVKYKDSTWASMLENRLRLARELLSEKGSIFVKCDYNGNMIVRFLMNEIFNYNNFRSELIWKRFTGTKIQYQSFPIVTDTIYLYTKSDAFLYITQFQPYSEHYLKTQFRYEDERGKYLLRNFYSPGDGPPRKFFGKSILPPKGHHWRMTQEKIDQLINEGRIVLDKKGFPKLKMYLHEMQGNPYSNLLLDFHVVQGSSEEFWNFPTQNPESLLKLIIQSSSHPNDLIMDFFLGSGTTTAVAHKLGRKWIGVEMGEHFWSVVLPRMKKVLAYDKSGISKELKIPRQVSPDTPLQKGNYYVGSGFFKYQILEQYEDTLDNIELKENMHAESLFKDEYLIKYFLDYETKESPYLLNIEHLKDPFAYKLRVNLTEVGEPEEIIIDIPETFNYLLGLTIKKIKVRHNSRKYLFILGEKEGRNVAIVWRKYDDSWTEEDFKNDKEFILTELATWNPHIVYINSQSVLTPKDFALRYIEPEFKRLMDEV